MLSATQDQNEHSRSEAHRAKATARLIYYAASEAEELGMGDCRQLLRFAADLIRLRFGLQECDLFQTSDEDEFSQSQQD